jgi:AcrR family transcriptional regulator
MPSPDLTQSSLVENNHGFIGAERGVLAHTVPHDIVIVSQRQRVLGAIADCCAEKTFAATTIADIVARAGVSRRTFYKLFANKQTCFEAAVNAFGEEIAATVAEARSDEDPWPDAIRKTIAAVLELLASKPALTKLALIEAVGVQPHLINGYWEMVVDKLRIPRPPDKEDALPADAARIAVGTAQVLIAQQVATGRTKQLPSLLPDLVYIAVLPFVGQEEALAQARLAG